MGIVERAYQLAATGEYAIPSEIAKRLAAEGHHLADIASTFEGLSLKRELLARCRAARPDRYRRPKYKPGDQGAAANAGGDARA